jgi:hypothetical protein
MRTPELRYFADNGLFLAGKYVMQFTPKPSVYSNHDFLFLGLKSLDALFEFTPL